LEKINGEMDSGETLESQSRNEWKGKEQKREMALMWKIRSDKPSEILEQKIPIEPVVK
jgi:hypothetical protein